MVTGLMAGALLLGSVPSHAATLALGPVSDGALQTALAGLGVVAPDGGERFVAQARIGDRGGAAEQELGLFGPPSFTGGPSVAPSAGSTQFNWGDAQPVAFSLTRSGGLVTFTVGTPTAPSFVASLTDPTANTLVLRLRAPDGGPHITGLSDLVVDGLAVGSASTNNGAANWLFTDLSANFVVSGNLAFDWSAPQPLRSNMAMQLKGYETAVPEPSVLALLGASLAGAAMRRRRRS